MLSHVPRGCRWGKVNAGADVEMEIGFLMGSASQCRARGLALLVSA